MASLTKSAILDPPRFVVPEAPQRASTSRIRAAMQWLFSSKRSLPSSPDTLIPREYAPLPTAEQAAAEQTKRRGGPPSFTQTLSAFGSRLLASPKKPSSIAYSMSMDELAGGLADAPPTPNTKASVQHDLLERLSSAVSENYRQCMHASRTAIAGASLPQVLALMARAAAEEVRLDPGQRIYLLFLHAGGRPGGHFVSRKSPVRIGRNYHGFAVKSRVVSRNHAEMGLEGQRAWIMDVGSHTGTFVNGARLSLAGDMSTAYTLRPGDIVQLGCNGDGADDDLSAVQFVVLRGTPIREGPPATQQDHDGIIPNDKLAKLYRRAMMADGRDKCTLYLEYGDIVHANSYGHAVFVRPDGPTYTARFNNYRLDWQVALHSAATAATVHAEAVSEHSFAVHADEAGHRRIARISFKQPGDVVVVPLSDERPLALSPKNVDAAVRAAVPCCADAGMARPASPYLRVQVGRVQTMQLPSPSTLFPDIGSGAQARPAIPFYTISTDGQQDVVRLRDRLDTHRDVVIGEGRVVGAKGRWAMAGARRCVRWQGEVACCRDDQLVVLALLLRALRALD